MKYELHLGGNQAQKLIHLIKKFDEKKIIKGMLQKIPLQKEGRH